MMKGKLQVLIFTVVLLTSMIAVSEGYFSNGRGKKNFVQVPQENSAFPKATRDLQLPQEEYGFVPLRKEVLCAIAEKTC